MAYVSGQAKRIIEKLGGRFVVARGINRHPVTVFKWMRPRAVGGTDGLIPAYMVGDIKRLATRLNKNLTAKDWEP